MVLLRSLIWPAYKVSLPPITMSESTYVSHLLLLIPEHAQHIVDHFSTPISKTRRSGKPQEVTNSAAASSECHFALIYKVELVCATRVTRGGNFAA